MVQTFIQFYSCACYLDLVLDLPGKMADDKSWLHHRRGHKVVVSLMLLLKFGKQGYICGMGKTVETTNK